MSLQKRMHILSFNDVKHAKLKLCIMQPRFFFVVNLRELVLFASKSEKFKQIFDFQKNGKHMTKIVELGNLGSLCCNYRSPKNWQRFLKCW